jgi:hypothetical protein
MFDVFLAKLDQLFIAIFARYRRKRGEAFIDSAWRSAANSANTYIIAPIIVPVLFVGSVLNAWLRVGNHMDHMRLLQITFVVIGFALIFRLERRFRKYLSAPPNLMSEEAISERNLIWFARAFSVGCLIAIAFVGYAIRQSGSYILKGF